MKRTVAMAVAIVALSAAGALAEQGFGSFGVDRRARLSFTDSGIGFVYALDISESPAAEEIRLADANDDGVIDETEKKIFLIRLATRSREGFRISINGAQSEIRLASANGDVIEKEDGRKIVKAEFQFNLSLPQGWAGGYITIDDAVFSDKVGARELIVDPAPGWEIATRDGILMDGYFLFRGPKGAGPWSARFEMTSKKAPPTDGAPAQTGSQPGSESRTTDIVFGALGVSWAAIAMLLLAVAVGAGHAVMPGFGGSLVSAYLVGPHNTVRHAALLGWVVTAIRTTPVFSIGIAIIILERFILPAGAAETMRLLCAVSVAAAGLVIIAWHALVKPRREPPMPVGVSTSEVVAFSIAGGFVPSPSAMALLFTAISLKQSVLGLGMVVAFGIGLESMMTLTGLLRVKAPSLADKLEDVTDRIRGFRLIWGSIILAVGVLSLFFV